MQVRFASKLPMTGRNIILFFRTQLLTSIAYAGVLPPCKTAVDIDWDIGDDTKFPSNRFWTYVCAQSCLRAAHAPFADTW
jgi:hypothetical protein